MVTALHRLGAEPVIMAAAGLWRVPLLGRALAREGHIPVFRGDRRAAAALDAAAEALGQGRLVLIYAEGGLPRRKDVTEAAPGTFRSGLARLAELTGAPVVPVGQAAPAGSPRAAPPSSSPAWSQRLCADRTFTCMWARRLN